MEVRDDGGPAFPDPAIGSRGEWLETGGHPAYGMSLRDYFAAKAMQGLLTNVRADQDWIGKNLALSAFNIADDMLRVRNLNG